MSEQAPTKDLSRDYIDAGAVISPCGKYRYLLWREWRGTHDPKNWRWFGANDGAGEPLGEPRACVFIMLNPSTADGKVDDPTIRRCVSFAKAWKFERLEVVNLFAYRATDPGVVLSLSADEAIGPDNQEYVEDAAAGAGKIVCAWGAHGSYLNQDETVRGWCNGAPTFALKFTKAGHPGHPLYVKGDTTPEAFIWNR
jgi:hypothetical protein